MIVSVFDISYDIDEEDGKVENLPTSFEFEIDNSLIIMEGALDDELADMISDRTGWCVNSFNYKIL
jgi:hypothetical protein